MREIKFRAYNAKYGQYEEYEKGKRSIYTPFDGLQREFNDVNENEYIFEQYTGLKDKNGREVYEGDKIRIDSYIDKVVEYSKSKCAFCFVNKSDIQHRERFDIEHSISKSWWNEFKDEVEVIGNIHEGEV